MIKIIRRLTYLVLLGIAGVAFWQTLGLRGVGEIDPAVLTSPRQTRATGSVPLKLEGQRHNYTLRPQYDYSINLLVTGRVDYDNKDEWPLVTDICGVWGTNITSGHYQNASYKQLEHACAVTSSAGRISPTLISNNHLIFPTNAMKERFRSVRVGDQINITGMLVDASLGSGPGSKSWNTSTRRNDDMTNGGGCEIILVQDFRVLEPAGQGIANYTYKAALGGIPVLFFSNLLWPLARRHWVGVQASKRL